MKLGGEKPWRMKDSRNQEQRRRNKKVKTDPKRQQEVSSKMRKK